ncbi:MAG: hypothetical protein VW475_10785 [Curvibacter sp.]
MLFRTFAVHITLNRMHTPALSSEEQAAIHVALAWVIKDWDWEMPTRTGLELQDFRAVAENWPEALNSSPSMSASAAHGAVREFWEAHRNAAEMLSLSPESLATLMQKLLKWVDDAV